MIIISLGSNVAGRWGDPATTIRRALNELNRSNITILRYSALYCTSPYGVTDQPLFLNAAAVVRTGLPPLVLLSMLKELENQAGRIHTRRWGPRALDVDIIDYNGRIMTWSPPRCQPINLRRGKHGAYPLILPHPQMQSRHFVLRPMQDIAPFWHHPVSGRSIKQLIARLRLRQAGQILDIVI